MKMPVEYHMALPYFPEKDIDGILSKFREILSGNGMLSMGANVREFETQFAKYVGCSHAVGVSSCSAAIEIALRSLSIGEGDEVIVPAETFIATGASVVLEGARPVFAGIDPNTFCLSAKTLGEKLTPRTRAVIAVHMAGLVTPEIRAIQKICSERNIALIEDAAHAPGAMYDGTRAGAFGDFGCFSFYPTKVMTTGEGGMLVTNDAELAKLADSYRNRGRDMDASVECYARLGTNNRMSEISALMGLSQLSHLESFIEARGSIASIYTESLSALDKRYGVRPLPLPPGARHSYWRYIVRIDERMDRGTIRDAMRDRGVAIDWAYDPPLHLQPVFRTMYETHEGMLPETESVMKSFICLPIHAGLTDADAQEISRRFVGAIEELYG